MQPVSFSSLVPAGCVHSLGATYRMEPACLARNRIEERCHGNSGRIFRWVLAKLIHEGALTGPANNENRNAAGLRSLAART
jgi:hypothetical protein